jgi:hypothetical protein
VRLASGRSGTTVAWDARLLVGIALLPLLFGELAAFAPMRRACG